MALAANWKLARKVMTLLYTKLKQRPALENIQPSHQVQLISILVSWAPDCSGSFLQQYLCPGVQ